MLVWTFKAREEWLPARARVRLQLIERWEVVLLQVGGLFLGLKVHLITKF